MSLTIPAVPTIAAFAATVVLLVAIPGPNVLFILGRGVDQGSRAAVAAAFGVELGTVVHLLGTTVGLAALIAASPVAFAVVKYAGVAYLLYLLIRALTSGPVSDAEAGKRSSRALPRLAGEAALVNVLNPKVALFFVALLPQYIDPGRGSVLSQTLLLGLLFFVIALSMDLVYATLAVPIGDLMRRSSLFRAAQKYVSAGAYLLLGVSAVFVSPTG